MDDEATTAIFHDIAKSIASDDLETAQKHLDSCREKIGEERETDMGDYLFATALNYHLSGCERERLSPYLRGYDIPQVVLMEQLSQQFPLVPMAKDIANAHLAQHIAGQEIASIIDIGVGLGSQLVSLIEHLDANDQAPKTLYIAAIDPQPQCLATAERKVTAAAEAASIDLHFVPMKNLIEGLTAEEWKTLEGLPGTLVVNAALVLHLIMHHEARALKDETLVRLRDLEPAALVMIEPNADHAVENYEQRFAHCYDYYSALFAAIDAAGLKNEDQQAFDICLYGREIVDILYPGKDRFVHHETAPKWLKRLEGAGFATVEMPAVPVSESESGSSITAEPHESYIGIGHDDTTLLAVIAAAPGGEQPALPETVPILNIDLPADFSDLEADIYLAALASVAKADQVIDLREREFIDHHAQLLDIEGEAHWEADSLDKLFWEGSEVTDYTAGVIIRDLIFLAKIDEEYHESEQAEIEKIAEMFGFDDEVIDEAESLVDEFLAPVPDDSPCWFYRYWYVGAKHQL